MQRFRLCTNLLAAFFLTAIFLGFFAKPAVADTTGFLSLINSYRQQNNLGTLVEDQNLTNAACWLSADLDINGFSHTDSLGRDMSKRLADFGVNVFGIGENIFYTTSGSSANYAFDAWKNSPGHNANMLGANYTRIGIGRVNVSGRWYWTTDFAGGTASTLNSQCGSTTNPTPTPPVVKKTIPTPIPAPIIVQAPPNEVAIATPSASETNLVVATKSASISAKVVNINGNQPKQEPAIQVLVKGSFLTISFIGYLILFGFIFWQLFHHFRLPILEHERKF